jgi:3D (Asp-Asp-Asp) domain-containing protein
MRIICIIFFMLGLLLLIFKYPDTAKAVYISKTCNASDWPAYTVTVTPIGDYYCTGYDPHSYQCCSKTDGITASGVEATAGKTIAMKDYSFGTRIYISGLGEFTVQDRGVGSGTIDIACNDIPSCYAITGHRPAYLIN